MAVSGRQALCPCGSGKKRKQCCGGRAALHHQDERLVEDMLAFAQRRFGRGWMDAPREAYFEGLEVEREDLPLFHPWVVSHWKVEGRPVRDWFLEEQGARLKEAERAWLLAQAPTVVSVWEAQAVRPGEGLTAKDLLRGETRVVHEVKGSRVLRPQDAVLGRVVDHEGLSVFCGLHPRTLPPSEAEEVVREARRALRVRRRWVPHGKLASEEASLELIHLWTDWVLALELELEPPVMPPRGEVGLTK